MAENWYFTSDEHIGHANVISFCNRPFSNIEEMYEGLIERHNSIVKPGDLTFHLGDAFWRSCPVEKAIEYMKRLNGNHYYIYGNHEELIHKHKELRDKFIWLRDLTTVRPNGYPPITLCHYALRTWPGSNRNSFSIYGHSHGQLPDAVAGTTKDENPFSMDCGVDTNSYYPWSLEQVKVKMISKGWSSK